jgi:hypothetical protein
MSYLPRGASTSSPVGYGAPPGVLVYLINQSVNGLQGRRLAAHYVLDCLRSHRTPDETAACLHGLEHSTLLQLSADVRVLALELGLLTVPVPKT